MLVNSCSASTQERVKVMLGRYQSSDRYVEVLKNDLEEEVARHLGIYGEYVGDAHWSKAVKKMLDLAGATELQHAWRLPPQLA